MNLGNFYGWTTVPGNISYTLRLRSVIESVHTKSTDFNGMWAELDDTDTIYAVIFC